MAHDKKSFVLYADPLNVVDKLPDDTAGQLFKIILKYVNDLNPEVEDLLLNIAFEPIKLQLKRDLINWNEVRDTKSNSGTIGNLKRWSPDLFNRYNKKEITLEEAVKIAEDRKLSQPDNVRSHNVANIAVNDTVNDTVIQKEVITPVVPTAAIDYNKFIEIFNSFANRKFRVTKKVKFSLSARLKEYSKEEILSAIKNAHLNQYHIETNFEYLTPEFILRPDKLEKFLNLPKNNETRGYTPQLTN